MPFRVLDLASDSDYVVQLRMESFDVSAHPGLHRAQAPQPVSGLLRQGAQVEPQGAIPPSSTAKTPL
jgi:hypothetical protein